MVYGQYAKFGDQWRIDGTLYDRKNSRQTPSKAEAASEKDQGRYGAALSSKEEALKIYRELAERSFWMTEILSGYGNALAQVGKKAEAQAILQEALTLARELKNSDQIASILGLLVDNAFYGGDLATAKQFFAQASQSSVHSTDRSLVMTAKFNLAKLSIEQGHAQEAIAVLTSLKDQANKTGPKFLALQSSVWLAKAYLQTKNYAKVQEILRPTILQTEKLGLISLTAQSHGLLSKLFRQQGNAAEAAREASAASQLFQQMQAEAHSAVASRLRYSALLKPPQICKIFPLEYRNSMPCYSLATAGVILMIDIGFSDAYTFHKTWCLTDLLAGVVQTSETI